MVRYAGTRSTQYPLQNRNTRSLLNNRHWGPFLRGCLRRASGVSDCVEATRSAPGEQVLMPRRDYGSGLCMARCLLLKTLAYFLRGFTIRFQMEIHLVGRVKRATGGIKGLVNVINTT